MEQLSRLPREIERSSNTRGFLYVGIDGCKAGWVAAGFTESNRLSIVVRRALPEILEEFKNASLVLVDLPIGLPDGNEGVGRACDREVRRMLKRGASSVFPVLCRQAVHAKAPDTPREVQMRLTGSGASSQALALIPKIAALDNWICAHKDCERWLRESHPELAFFTLNGHRPLRCSKHDLLGGLERERLLAPYLGDLIPQLPGLVGAGVSSNDLMDAMVLAVHAQEGSRSGLTSIPSQAQRDLRGLRMEMVYASYWSKRP